MSIEDTVEALKDKYYKTELEVGKIVMHPKDGRVKILSGQFWVECPGGKRLSNHWTWVKVSKKGNPQDLPKSGYGWM